MKFIYYFIIFLGLSYSDTKKTKTKKAKKPLPSISSPKRPDLIVPAHYCHSCNALIEIAMSNLYGRKSEMDVAHALDKICDYDNFMTYNYPPMEMTEGCYAFLQGYEENLETFLNTRTTENINDLQT